MWKFWISIRYIHIVTVEFGNIQKKKKQPFVFEKKNSSRHLFFPVGHAGASKIFWLQLYCNQENRYPTTVVYYTLLVDNKFKVM